MSDRALQKQCFDECVAANWDPHFKLTFAEEIAHLHAELAEAFEALRRHHDFLVRPGVEMVPIAPGRWHAKEKPEGVPIEFADVLIGMFYLAERFHFDLLDAVEVKHQYNLTRDYQAEGRYLH